MTVDSIGKPWHEEALWNLLELNPDVSGTSRTGLLNDQNINEFNFIIATEVDDYQMKFLCNLCKQAGIPIIFIRTYGHIAYIRTYSHEHTVL